MLKWLWQHFLTAPLSSGLALFSSRFSLHRSKMATSSSRLLFQYSNPNKKNFLSPKIHLTFFKQVVGDIATGKQVKPLPLLVGTSLEELRWSVCPRQFLCSGGWGLLSSRVRSGWLLLPSSKVDVSEESSLVPTISLSKWCFLFLSSSWGSLSTPVSEVMTMIVNVYWMALHVLTHAVL